MVSKKILTPYDLQNPDKNQRGFLYPFVNKEGKYLFLEIATGKEWEFAMVVYTGMEITTNDVFAKIIDSPPPKKKFHL